MPIGALAGPAVKALVKLLSVFFAIDIGGRAVNLGTRAATGKTFSQLVGISPTDEKVSSLQKQAEKVRTDEFFRQVRQDKLELGLELTEGAQDRIEGTQDVLELNVLRSKVLPLLRRTGLSLGDLTGDDSGNALRALVSSQNQKKIDAVPIELAFGQAPQSSQTNIRAQALGVASPAIQPAPSEAAEPLTPDSNPPIKGSAQGG